MIVKNFTKELKDQGIAYMSNQGINAIEEIGLCDKSSTKT